MADKNPEKRSLRDRLTGRGKQDKTGPTPADKPEDKVDEVKQTPEQPPKAEAPKPEDLAPDAPTGFPGLDEIDFDAMDPEEAEGLRALITYIRDIERENEDLRRTNSKLRAKADKAPALEHLQKQVADMQNAQDKERKRFQRLAKQDADREMRKFALAIVSVADNLDRALEHVKGGTTPRKGSKAAALLSGVETTANQFSHILKQWGIEKMDVAGKPFNPEQHEAMMVTPTTEKAEHDTISQVLESGYMMKGKLLRAARVAVAKHPNPKTDRRRPLAM